MNEHLVYLLLTFAKLLTLLMILLGCVAYLTLAERKVIAFMQVRLGPRRVGPHGLLQPIADVLKLLLKEDIMPKMTDRLVFFFAPIFALVPALAVFVVIPFEEVIFITDVNIGLLYILAVSSLGIYGIVLGGWASNSKYPMLGALRSSAQMVSYEIPLAFAIVGVLLFTKTLSMGGIVQAQVDEGMWFILYQPFGFVIYLIAAIAETNRSPFDLPEAENELVAGFHTEYSGMKFAFFFLAEYINMIVVACVATVLFFGGWHVPFLSSAGLPPVLERIIQLGAFLGKTAFFLYAYLWIRATFPRYRYDQLMNIGWKWLIPLSLVNILVTGLLKTLGINVILGNVVIFAILVVVVMTGKKVRKPRARLAE